MKKTWIEFRVDAPPVLTEAVADFLIEKGSPGVIQEDIQRPGVGKMGRTIGYFPNDLIWKEKKRDLSRFLRSLRRRVGPPLRTRSRTIREERWAEAWKENFKTLHVTRRLVVTPPWEGYTPAKGEAVIVIDPGMAFGTGTHPSTQMCLAALEETIPSFPRPPSLLDVGTGSGILAIAARKLKAGPVMAVEIDPLALRCARENAGANGVGRSIEFRPGSANSLRRVFDIVVANLLPQELLGLSSILPRRVSSGGVLVVSGLLVSQRKEIEKAFFLQGMKVRREKNQRAGLVWFLTGTRQNGKSKLHLRRFRIEKGSICGDRAVIRERAEIRHIGKVLRMRAGDRLILFDGEGTEYRAAISAVSPKEIVLQLTGDPAFAAKEPSLEIILGIGLLRTSQLDWVVQKATELGLTRLIPFYSERVVPHLREERTRTRQARWEKIAVEAAKQCGRAGVPRIDAPVPFPEALARGPEKGLKIILWEDEPAGSLGDFIGRDFSAAFALVGPEGGFTDEEAARAKAAGFHPIRFGPRILRAETAAISILVMLQFIGGDLR